MMRTLFLDDDRQRYMEFSDMVLELRKRGELGDVDIKWALNAQMAKHFLQECLTFDVAFLDHDLATEHYVHFASDGPMKEEDGKAVAKAIAALPPEERPKLCHIHSWNWPGAKSMEKTLTEAGVRCTQAMFPKGIKDILASVWAMGKEKK